MHAGPRRHKTETDTHGCGQNQALDCRATGNSHDFFSSKRGVLEIRGSRDLLNGSRAIADGSKITA